MRDACGEHAGPERVLDERDVVLVDGEQFTLRQGDDGQRDTGACGGLPR